MSLQFTSIVAPDFKHLLPSFFFSGEACRSLVLRRGMCLVEDFRDRRAAMDRYQSLTRDAYGEGDAFSGSGGIS